MIIVPFPVGWLGIALGAWLIAHLLGWRLTRPLGWRHARAVANRIAEAHTDPLSLAQGTAAELQVEGINARWRRKAARAARLGVVAASRRRDIARLEARRSELSARTDEIRATSATVDERPPFITERTSSSFNAALFAGDLFVVASALAATDAAMSLLQAMVTSLAIATALFVAGKVAGDRLRHREHETMRLGVGLAVFTGAIGLIAWSLFLLRLGRVEAWIGLAVAPALGAGGTTLLGPSRLQKAAHRLERMSRQTMRRQRRRELRLSRLEGRREQLVTITAIDLARTSLHAEAQALLVGLPEAASNLENVARRVGVTLGERFQAAPSASHADGHDSPTSRRLIVVNGRARTTVSPNGGRRE